MQASGGAAERRNGFMPAGLQKLCIVAEAGGAAQASGDEFDNTHLNWSEKNYPAHFSGPIRFFMSSILRMFGAPLLTMSTTTSSISTNTELNDHPWTSRRLRKLKISAQKLPTRWLSVLLKSKA